MHVIPSRPVRVSLRPPPDPVELSISDGERLKSTTRRIALVATTQRGIVSNEQLRRIGLHPRTIGRLVAKGWLIPLHHGVYAVGHRPRTFEGLAWAAVLACGAEAKTSHGTSATCHALLNPYHRVHVTTPTKRSRPGMANHTAITETVWIDGLPCTTVARTLVDLAGCVPSAVLESAVRQAQVRGVLEVQDIAALMLELPRARGVRRLRAILGDPVLLAPTRSTAERIALRALLKDGWPWPQVGVEVHGEEVDFTFPDLKLGLEIDGATHRTQVQQARDAARDAKLRALGWKIVRVPDTEAASAPAELRRVVGLGPPRTRSDKSTQGRAASGDGGERRGEAAA